MRLGDLRQALATEDYEDLVCLVRVSPGRWITVNSNHNRQNWALAGDYVIPTMMHSSGHTPVSPFDVCSHLGELELAELATCVRRAVRYYRGESIDTTIVDDDGHGIAVGFVLTLVCSRVPLSIEEQSSVGWNSFVIRGHVALETASMTSTFRWPMDEPVSLASVTYWLSESSMRPTYDPRLKNIRYWTTVAPPLFVTGERVLVTLYHQEESEVQRR